MQSQSLTMPSFTEEPATEPVATLKEAQPGLYSGDGREFDLYRPAAGQTLPVGTYVLNAHPMRGFYLARTDDMQVPARIYGQCPADRILVSYEARRAQGQSTGVWLNGEKGSGKTMLAAVLAQRMRQQGYPTILIPTAFSGAGFNAVIAHIGEACVLFDEFEKVYENKSQQNDLLTMFAGQVVARHLYVVTTNTEYAVIEAMKNRPSRMRYLIQFRGVPEDVVRDYMEHNLKDQRASASMIKALSTIPDCNFDIMQTAVEEYNIHGGSVEDLLSMMNITRHSRATSRFMFAGKVRNGDTWLDARGSGTWKGTLAMISTGDCDGDPLGVGMRISAIVPHKDYINRTWHAALDVAPLKYNEDGSITASVNSDDTVGTVTFAADRGFSEYRQRF
jgi:hypothetical protein